jgi:acyl-CoA synthetase (AMP-forming)/AMP-acid ligase II
LVGTLLRDAGIRLPKEPARIALTGDSAQSVASLALALLNRGHQIVMAPRSITEPTHLPLRAGYHLHVTSRGPRLSTNPAATAPIGDWRVALYSSGSTGPARAYGFTSRQLHRLADWYHDIYGVTTESVIVTSLPVTYNFTFVAGLVLAATTGARLLLAETPRAALSAAAEYARTLDRVVILANPVTLHHADSRLPDNVLIDSGGAPLSVPGIQRLRRTVGDVREGYGLTETGSLTHFDTEGTSESVGTVGVARPGVHCAIEDVAGKPHVVLETPALGVEVAPDGTSGPPRTRLRTGDLGLIDTAGRLRLLGRADDHLIAGHWPRDTHDLVGTVIGARCALVLHPAPNRVRIRLLEDLPREAATAVQRVVSAELRLKQASVAVERAHGRMLHSHKLSRQLTGLNQ